MTKRKYVSMAIALATVASMAVAIPAFAQTTSGTPASTQAGSWKGKTGMMQRPGVVGTVSAISGSTITVTSKIGPRMRTKGTTVGTTPTPITYTVNATNATITKNNVAGTISSIVVGDLISVSGTVTGTNVVATTIRDGLAIKGQEGTEGTTGKQVRPVGTPVIQGNGQPVVAGSITTITGNLLTVTTQSGIAYTVDSTNAKIVQGPNTITFANLAVGNTVVVQGAVSGTSITASSIIDQVKPVNTTGSTQSASAHTGFFGGIGSFFSHLFGF